MLPPAPGPRQGRIDNCDIRGNGGDEAAKGLPGRSRWVRARARPWMRL